MLIQAFKKEGLELYIRRCYKCTLWSMTVDSCAFHVIFFFTQLLRIRNVFRFHHSRPPNDTSDNKVPLAPLTPFPSFFCFSSFFSTRSHPLVWPRLTLGTLNIHLGPHKRLSRGRRQKGEQPGGMKPEHENVAGLARPGRRA